MKFLPSLLAVCFLLLLASPMPAQRRRDPLTQPEIEKIRDASWEPKQRLPLYVEFARERLVKLMQVDTSDRFGPEGQDLAVVA